MEATILQCAQKYLEYGYSVIPVDLKTEQPIMDIEEYKKRLPTNSELVEMFGGLGFENYGIAFICGKVSGNLEVIRFIGYPSPSEGIVSEYINVDKISKLYNEFDRFYLTRNANGFDILYKFSGDTSATKVLAEKRVENGKYIPLIKLFGEGDFVIVYPTSKYIIANKNFKTPIIPTFSIDERNTLIEVAKLFNESISVKIEKSKYGKHAIINRIAEKYNNSDDGILYFNKYLMEDLHWEKGTSNIWKVRDENNQDNYGWYGDDKRNRIFVASNAVKPLLPNLYYAPFDFLVQFKYKNNYIEAAKFVCRTELNDKGLDEILQLEKTVQNTLETYISVDDESQELIPYIYIKNEDETSIIGSVNNFSVISGKAKVGKTLLLNEISSSLFIEQSIIQISEEAKRKKILYFDTEQSRGHSTKIYKRILQKGKIDKQALKDKFDVHNITRLNPQERVSRIEEILYSDNQIGILIIDGVRDLLRNFNNPDEVYELINKILCWKDTYPIHILVVIHENKGNSLLRGHLGTELENKAETVIGLSKKDDIIRVKCKISRNIGFKPFAYKIIEDGLLEPMVISTLTQRVNRLENLSQEQHILLLNSIFSEVDNYGYGDLSKKIKFAFSEVLGIIIGTNKVKKFITHYIENNYITKDDKKYLLSEPHKQ